MSTARRHWRGALTPARALALGLLAALLYAGSGLASLERRLAEPRLSQNTPSLEERGRIEAAMGALPGRFLTRAGLALDYALLEPGAYGLEVEVQRGRHTEAAFRFQPRVAGPAPAPRGSVLMLHGWGMDRSSLYPWALQLAEAGYRVLLVDLRGHGASGDLPPGYGRREAEDIGELLDALQGAQQLPAPLHLLGVSYGAATAAHLAAARPQAFNGMLLMEPFANAADAVRQMVPALLDDPEAPLWRQPLLAVMKLQFSPQRLERAIERVGTRLDLALDEVELAPRLQATGACAALLHGSQDRHVPVEHGRRLAAEVPGLRFAELPQEDHISLPARLDWLGLPLVQWLQQVETAQGDCPPLRLPPDPLLTYSAFAASALPPAPARLDRLRFELAGSQALAAR